jgi:hypothetical protein
VGRQILKDLKTVPTEQGELDIALCNLIGFGVPIDFTLGLEHLICAARAGMLGLAQSL